MEKEEKITFQGSILPKFGNYRDFRRIFPDEQSCINYLEAFINKGKKPISPFDSNSKVYECADKKVSTKKYSAKYKRFHCKTTGKYFTVRNNTIFENTKLPLLDWFHSFYSFANRKRGIPSCQLAEDNGCNWRSAWFLTHRLRYIADSHSTFRVKLKGEWEGDETGLGGSNSNKHWDKKLPHSQGRSWKGKIIVFVMEQRGGYAIADIVSNTKRDTLVTIIRANAEEGSNAYTDELPAYKILGKWYNHQIVNHRRKQYKNGKASTNLVENYNSHLKRMVYGNYFKISKKYAQKYVDEFTFRRNTRKYSVQDRFNLLLSLAVGKRLTYKEFTSNKINNKCYEQQTNNM
jgi:transposase-like protein